MAEPRGTHRLFAVPRVMFLGLAIWGAWYASRRQSRHVLGTVVVDGAQVVIEGCKKVPVEGRQSFGVDLRGPDGDVVRVIRDEQGERLSLLRKGSAAALPFERRACSQWKLELFSDPSDLLTPVGGRVSFTCTVDGRKIEGAASFDDCGS